MVLDVCGTVDHWITKKKIMSFGPNGIGFVNFGHVKTFKAEDSIETYGMGARGFNQYDGIIQDATFKSIKTVGDGSIGMQFSKPVGRITIQESVITEGSSGETLVKGIIKVLKADAISVLDGGILEELNILGDLVTKGEDVVAYHVNGGLVKAMYLKGKIMVHGKKSRAVLVEKMEKRIYQS